MRSARFIFAVTLLCGTWALAQDTSGPPPANQASSNPAPTNPTPTNPAPAPANAPPAPANPAPTNAPPSPANPAPAAPTGVTLPKVISSVAPIYPEGHKEESHVVLSVTLGVQGEVEKVSVFKSGGADFDRAAETAVRQWKFEPAKKDGVPMEAIIKVPFGFPAPVQAPAPPPTPAAPAPAPTAPAPAPAAPAPGPPPPVVIAVPTPAPANAPPPAEVPQGAVIVGVRGEQKHVDRGGSDIEVKTETLSDTARTSAESILQQAPGIFIANEGGLGHADQVFLRGFDAEQGQDIEFTVNGVPINEVDNTDGHGYADTHFIIPEVVKSLNVVEGPFDPHQGDFAVAGSANYELGVPLRGLHFEETYGSFDTTRTLALWAPVSQREGTFAAVQMFNTNGYGSNRADTNASAMAQYEGELGTSGLWRLLAMAYGTHYSSAGVISASDLARGLVPGGYYGTEDPSQGGDAQRYTLAFDLENPIKLSEVTKGVVRQQVFVTWRTMHIIEDFTGFIEDLPNPANTILQSQRGDGIDQDYSALTVGGRGSYRITGLVRDAPQTPAERADPFRLFGGEQAVEFGYYARYDHTTPSIQRVRFGTDIPYSIDENLTTDIVNLAGFVDADISPFKWLTLRGGVRQEFFDYDILNECATLGDYKPTEPLNVDCPSYDSSGFRLPTQRVTATGFVTEPKATALINLPQGLQLTGSYGIGAQSLDAVYISQNENAPFSKLTAGEGGVILRHRWVHDDPDDRWRDIDVSARAVGYYTHVGVDLVFDPTSGRLSETTGTTRRGAVVALALAGHWFNETASFTYAYATYDQAFQGGTLVPYVPDIVARSDTSLKHELPWTVYGHGLLGSVGLGLNYVGERALPFSEFSAPTFTMDGSASVRWRWVKVGLLMENLTNAQYPLTEYFYASNFSQPDYTNHPYPILTPSLHFTAAPPRAIFLTVAVLLDKDADL